MDYVQPLLLPETAPVTKNMPWIAVHSATLGQLVSPGKAVHNARWLALKVVANPCKNVLCRLWDARGFSLLHLQGGIPAMPQSMNALPGCKTSCVMCSVPTS